MTETGWALARAAEPEEPACLHTRGWARRTCLSSHARLHARTSRHHIHKKPVLACGRV